MVNPVKFAARSLLASVFVSGGINQLKAPHVLGPVVDRAKDTYGVDVPVSGKDLVSLNGAGMVAAGATMALGIMPRLSALGLAALLVPTTVVGHPFWAADEKKRMPETTAFLSNASILGGLLMVALDRRKK